MKAKKLELTFMCTRRHQKSDHAPELGGCERIQIQKSSLLLGRSTPSQPHFDSELFATVTH